ncbi:sugar ABC transporter substrate-binding protein [Spirochaetia bacterium]|nr:sugar ABC transporter substrate-binding protein [Spirochaetia bacterium]
MKRLILMVSVLLISASTLVFGGGQQGASSNAAAGTKVQVWGGHSGNDRVAIDQIIAAYNAGNPVQQVEYIYVTGDMTDITKLLTAVRAGTGPDVYLLDRFTVGERAAQGVLEDITDRLKAIDPNLKDKYLEFAWNEAQFRGRTYALPWETDARAIYYRKDILRDAGIDVSILDPSRGPVTIAQLTEIANKLNVTDAQGNYTRIGFIPWAAQGWHYTFGFVFGGKFADLAAGKVTPMDRGVVAAYQYFYDTGKALGPQKVRTFLSTYDPPNLPPEQSPFYQGNLPIMITGDWEIANIREYAPNIDYGITWLPIAKAGDKSTSFAGGWSMVIPTGAKNVDGGVRFMAYATGEAGQRVFAKVSGHLPTWKSLLNDNSLFSERHQFFRELLPLAQSRPVLPMHAFYWDQLTAAQNDVSMNLKTPEEALRSVESQSQAQLNRFLPLQ